MLIDPDSINGWEKDHWKITTPGNWAEFIAKNENGVKVWLTDPGGRGDNWKVKVGLSTKLNESTHVFNHTSFDTRNEALLKAAEFMEANPDLKWQRYDYPNLVTGDGNRAEIPSV